MSNFPTDIDITQHLAIVTLVAKRYFNLGIDHDDILSEGKRGLVWAKDYYDGSTPFYCYSQFWIKKFIKQLVKSHFEKIHNVSSEQDHESAYLSLEDALPQRNHNKSVSKIDIQSLLEKADLNPKEIKVLNYRFGLQNTEVKTFKELGRIFNCSGESVRLTQNRAMKKLQKVVSNER